MSKKKDAILHVAMVLFANKGFQATTMQDISRHTGAAEGTIFYHFKSKEQLLVSILECMRIRIIEEFERYLADRSFATGMDMMEEAVSFYLYLAGLMADEFLLLQSHFIYRLAEENEDCRGHLEAIYNCLADIFERAIFMGQADGSMGSFHPRKTALILFSMVDGLVRFKTFNLYDAGALYVELVDSCRRMLKP